jgi:hypothetical protein
MIEGKFLKGSCSHFFWRSYGVVMNSLRFKLLTTDSLPIIDLLRKSLLPIANYLFTSSFRIPLASPQPSPAERELHY